MSASNLAWLAAGRQTHKYQTEQFATVCATCAAQINVGVHISQIETPTTADHASYFRFGSKHVCDACAWLYDAGKGRPGNYIATSGSMEYCVISLESVVEDKRPWIEVLPEIAGLQQSTPVAGVMTTDVKPRLWPRVRLATVGRFGLYIHAPDYDVSEWREFSLPACLELIREMVQPLAAGYAKASIYHGLLRDHARSAKDISRAIAWESVLSNQRSMPHFLPALIAAGVTKESKRNVKPTARPVENPEPTADCGDQDNKTQLGLF